MSGPTRRQTEVHEAVIRHGGNYEAAGRELGITGQGVGFTERRYREAMGEPPRIVAVREPRPKRPSRIQILASLPGRMDALEAGQEDQVAVAAAVAYELAELRAAINGFMARQPLILEVRPRNHRKADGGEGGREEVRETRRQLRKVAGG